MAYEAQSVAGPRDVFLHLLAVIFLAASVISFGAVIFGLVDLYVPDVLGERPYGVRDALRFPLAALVVVFPLYTWLSYYISRDVSRNPEKRALKSRRWLIAFTLFVASVVIVGDLVALIYQFLNGELSLHFLLKVLAIFLTAGSVSLYYSWIWRKNISVLAHPYMRIFAFSVFAVVVATIVAGFVAAGSPSERRERRLDEQRVGDMQVIQSEVVYFWQAKERLPTTLSELKDELRGFVPPQDPEAGIAYEYRIKNALSFELCAEFNLPSEEQTGQSAKPIAVGIEESWAHGAGRACFVRTIDPERFPPFKKTRQ